MERRGIRTERGDINRAIEIKNTEIRQLRARIIKLDKWIAEEAKNSKPPTLADVITNILNKRGLHHLQAAAKVLVFLQNNGVQDVAGLENMVQSMYGKINSLREDLTPINRRIKTLEEHIRHSGNFKKYRKIAEKQDALYAEYKTLSQQGLFSKGKANKALEAAEDFSWKHLNALQDYENAEKYLRGVLQKRFDPGRMASRRVLESANGSIADSSADQPKKLPPIDMWRKELAAKTAERDVLYREYENLKSETQNVEQIQRSVKDILHSDTTEHLPERTGQKTWGMEL
jgi:hypothetical protein